MTEGKLDLTRTRAAVAAYDALAASLERMRDAADLGRMVPRLDAAETAVGEAFALDTADRNPPDVARTIGPGDPWLRALLAREP